MGCDFILRPAVVVLFFQKLGRAACVALGPFWRHNTNSSGFTPAMCFVQPIRVAHQEDWMIIFVGATKNPVASEIS